MNFFNKKILEIILSFDSNPTMIRRYRSSIIEFYVKKMGYLKGIETCNLSNNFNRD